jgi:Nuclease-related domain
VSPLLFLLGFSVLCTGITVVAFLIRQRSRQDRAPFPENTRLLRAPGESLRRKLAQLDETFLTLFAAGCLLPLFLSAITALVVNLLAPDTTLLTLTAASLVFFLTTAYLVNRLLALADRRRNTALGYFGELAVAEALDPLKATGHRVFHDVPGEGPAGKAFNLDHVVVGPAGVFAIETKTRRKGRARTGFMAHEIIYDGRALAYPWGEDTFGLDQSRRQAEWLASFLQQQLGRPVPVAPLLVFPGWFIIRKGSGAVNVLNPRELPSAIERTASGHTGFVVPALDPAAIDLISRQLEARCRDVEL